MILLSFLPILLFVAIYVGTGVYLSFMGVHNAFYQLSPTVAIIPAIALGWILHRGSTERKMHAFLDGMRHPDIITMCIIFLLAGAFSSVTNAIGSVDATVNLALSFISPQFLLIGLFYNRSIHFICDRHLNGYHCNHCAARCMFCAAGRLFPDYQHGNRCWWCYVWR